MLAPLEYAVIRLPGEQPAREIVSALADLQRAGSIGVRDLLLVARDAAGATTVREFDEFGDAASPADTAVADELARLLTIEDIGALAEDLPPKSAAVVVLLEHRWVNELAAAIGRADGGLVAGGLVDPDALARVSTEIEAVAGA